MNARHASQLLGDRLIRTVFRGHAAQRDGRREANKTVASVPDHRKEFLYAVQYPQVWRGFALDFTSWCAAKHHRDRQHLDIQRRIIAMQIEVIVKDFHRFHAGHKIGEDARAIVDEYVARQQ